MLERTKITLLHPDNLYGSERYTLTIEIINLSDKPLSNINIEAQLVPGKNLSVREELRYSGLSERELKKQSLIKEVNLQAMEACRLLKIFEHSKESDKNLDSQIEQYFPQKIGELHFSLFSLSLWKSFHDSKVRNKNCFDKIKNILLYEVTLDKISLPFLFDFETTNNFWETADKKEIVIPYWAREASTIDSWEDLERVEKLIMNEIPDIVFSNET